MQDKGNEATTPPQAWLADIAASEADFAAGRLVDGGEIHRQMRQALKRLHDRPGSISKAEPSQTR